MTDDRTFEWSIDYRQSLKILSCLLHNDTKERTHEDPCVVEKRYEACPFFSFKERKIRRERSEEILERS